MKTKREIFEQQKRIKNLINYNLLAQNCYIDNHLQQTKIKYYTFIFWVSYYYMQNISNKYGFWDSYTKVSYKDYKLTNDQKNQLLGHLSI